MDVQFDDTLICMRSLDSALVCSSGVVEAGEQSSIDGKCVRMSSTTSHTIQFEPLWPGHDKTHTHLRMKASVLQHKMATLTWSVLADAQAQWLLIITSMITLLQQLS